MRCGMMFNIILAIVFGASIGILNTAALTMSGKNEVCKWKLDISGYLKTDCGHTYLMICEDGCDDTDKFMYNFCPSCGRKIKEVQDED